MNADEKFQTIAPDTVERASDLIGWTIVAVHPENETESWDSEIREYDGLGLVVERDGQRKRTWLWGAPEAGATFASLILDRRAGQIERMRDIGQLDK